MIIVIAMSSLHLEPSPTRTLKWLRRNRVQIRCNTSSAYHLQYNVNYNRQKKVKFRDLAGNAEEEEENETQRYSWECRRRIRRMMNPRDIAGNAEEE